jgi:hypothetical protein
MELQTGKKSDGRICRHFPMHSPSPGSEHNEETGDGISNASVFQPFFKYW